MTALDSLIVSRTTAATLADKLRTRTARCGVIGLGYVGLPLAVELARTGFHVTGIDKDPSKVREVGQGRSYIADIDSQIVADLVRAETLRADDSDSLLRECDAVSICVPTPLRKTREPDMTFVINAAEALAKNMHPGLLVILESTTYPGTTEEAVLPILERSGLRAGGDFFLCFSPERIDPGNSQYTTRTIPKVIGGVTPRCTELGSLFYSQVMDRVVPVSSTKVAEMVKLLENTFRLINIGLANEMALMCDRMGINVWEVIDAAATKPFGFTPFYPGPGLGGHCIPVDPHYLSWKTRQVGHQAQFIELAAQINGMMPRFVVDKITDALNGYSKAVRGAKVHIVGAAYKKNVSDTRESPALDIILMLRQRGAVVSYTDPYVSELRVGEDVMRAVPLEPAVDDCDCAVVVTDHTTIDYERLVRSAPLIIDTRNALKDFSDPKILSL